jgi:hypothetical protein
MLTKRLEVANQQKNYIRDREDKLYVIRSMMMVAYLFNQTIGGQRGYVIVCIVSVNLMNAKLSIREDLCIVCLCGN